MPYESQANMGKEQQQYNNITWCYDHNDICIYHENRGHNDALREIETFHAVLNLPYYWIIFIGCRSFRVPCIPKSSLETNLNVNLQV